MGLNAFFKGNRCFASSSLGLLSAKEDYFFIELRFCLSPLLTGKQLFDNKITKFSFIKKYQNQMDQNLKWVYAYTNE